MRRSHLHGVLACFVLLVLAPGLIKASDNYPDSCTCRSWIEIGPYSGPDGAIRCVAEQEVSSKMYVRWTPKDDGTCFVCYGEDVRCPSSIPRNSGAGSGIVKTCQYGGEVSGIGGDGREYRSRWEGFGELETVPYEYKKTPFFHFLLNGNKWPNPRWGVSVSTWKVTCLSSGASVVKKACSQGGRLSGIGGDGNYYFEDFSGYGVIETLPYKFKKTPFYHFRLNGKKWPTPQWGVSVATWKLECH